MLYTHQTTSKTHLIHLIQNSIFKIINHSIITFLHAVLSIFHLLNPLFQTPKKHFIIIKLKF
jgi:hypothetical protein